MNDYIKREDAINVFCWGEDLYVRCGIATQNIKDIPSADVVEVDKAQKEIDYWHDRAQSYEQTILKLSLNKADVVEVVRCKDCEYWDDHERCDFWSSLMSPHYPEKNDYCSYGERADA